MHVTQEPHMEKLFEPIDIGSVRIRNRVVMAPMTRNRADETDAPQRINVEYYRQRAGAGLIITEASQVSPQGKGYLRTPGIHSDRQITGWRYVTDAVHAAGGCIFLQLWHVGRISHPSFQPDRALPVAPSAIRPDGEVRTESGRRRFVTPRALHVDEVGDVVAQFRTGAENAKDAGFDGVEIHAANGYLIDQFLRDGTNRRTDAYGGSIARRARLLLEVIDAVSSAWSAGRTGVRLSPISRFNDMMDSDPAATFGHAAEALSARRLAYLHVVETGPGTFDWSLLRRKFAGPYMANGDYSRERAAEALQDGRADLVSFGIPFLANPDLVERFRRGASLNEPDRSSFYGGDARGYVDYPELSAQASA